MHEKCFSTPLEDPAIREDFEHDEFMLKLRAKNLVEHLAHLSYPRLALALESVRNDLAGLVACYVFEREIQNLAESANVSLKKKNEEGKTVYKKIPELLQELQQQKVIDEGKRGRWNRLRDIRNKVFHAKVDAPSPKEIQDLVTEILRMTGENV